MLTMNPEYKPAIVDGYLRHVAACFHDQQLGESAPMSFSDWYEYAIMYNDLNEEVIHTSCLVYYPDTNLWRTPSPHYRAVQLVCSPRFQPRKATLQMECTLRNQSPYTLRYKATGYKVDENPEITHNGETKTLLEWGETLGVCSSTMQQRYKQMLNRSETMSWLLRPKYTHSKFCDEQA